MASQKGYEPKLSQESIVQAGAGATERVEELVGSIGQTVDTAAQVVQDTFLRTKRSAGDAMISVTEGIETSTEYFTDRGVVGVVEDVEALIRRYPFQALLIGSSVGYLLSRSWKR